MANKNYQEAHSAGCDDNKNTIISLQNEINLLQEEIKKVWNIVSELYFILNKVKLQARKWKRESERHLALTIRQCSTIASYRTELQLAQVRERISIERERSTSMCYLDLLERQLLQMSLTDPAIPHPPPYMP